MSSLSRALVAIVAVVPVLIVNAGSAQAQDFAVAAQVGTTGLGGGAVIGVLPKVNVRAMYGIVPGDPSVEVELVNFGLDLPSFLLTTVDLYPFGGFHLSAGGLWISNAGLLNVEGTFDGISKDFAGMVFTGSIDDRLLGTFALKSFQPYLGIGIGNPLGKRISVNFDAGIGFGSLPTVELTPEGPLANDPLTGPTYRAQVELEEANIQAGIPDFLKYYPVLALSLSFGF